MEIWKDIKGFEGYYQINQYGDVRGVERLVNHYLGGKRRLKSRIVKQSIGTIGYPVVQLWRDNKKGTLYIHRLTAENFIPNPENKEEVNHKDGNKANNSLENLEWVSRKENMNHAYENGLIKESTNANKNGKIQGEKNYQAKLTESDIFFIRKNSIKNGGLHTYRELAKKFNVSNANISNIVNKKIWKHVK